VRIPAALTRPAADDPAAAVLLVPGSLFLDVDGDMPAFGTYPHAYRDLARQLASQGYGVLRFAKIGPGTGSETFDPDAAEVHKRFETRVDVAAIALARLLERVGGAGRPIVLAGHSEGAVVATLLAEREPAVDGLILLSGPSVGILDIMREQLPIPRAAGPEAYDAFDRAVRAVRNGDPIPADIADHPTTRGLAWVGPENMPFLVGIDRVNPAAELGKLPTPVLIVQGGADASVRPYHADVLAAAHHRGTTELARFPGLTHFYKPLPAGMTPADPAAFGLDGPSDSAVADRVAAWIARLER
jgi:alpha-beta hydrolase superfamily lysophospholipase